MVDRPIDDVWASLTDFFNGPRLWGPRVRAVRQTSPGPLGVGTILQGRLVFLGFEGRFKFVFTEWDPPHAVAYSGTMRPFKSLLSRYDLETLGNGTRLTRSGHLELPFAMTMFWSLLRPFVMRGMHDASRTIKQFVESRPRSVG